jgi:hypothetical protein
VSSYSTEELPKLADFNWLTGEAAKGNIPSGAKQIKKFENVTGGWKAYMYGSKKEWLMNVDIEAAQSGATVSIDWYYTRDGNTGESREDDTPTSTFTGSWDKGTLDATGSGRITLVAFWKQDDHQYAVGSFMWPSGETGTIALVRP